MSEAEKTVNLPWLLSVWHCTKCVQWNYILGPYYCRWPVWWWQGHLYRQRRKLYAQANMLCRKFSMCSVPVKISLFRAYCTPLYTAHLWCRYKQGSIRKLTVAYNDSMRQMLRAPRSSSASHMFVSVRVPTCSAVLRNLMYTFMCRASESENDLIAVLVNPVRSSVRFSSRLWNHWRTCLYARHWILWKAVYFLLCVFSVCSDMDPPGSEINTYTNTCPVWEEPSRATQVCVVEDTATFNV